MKVEAKKALLTAGDALASRMRLFAKEALQAQERGETEITIDARLLFEPGDAAALEAWDRAKAEALGQPRLFVEEEACPC